MARPERHDADYFPFFAKRGKTLNILQSKYGLEGIGFFTNLMRFLSLTPDHHYCIKDETDRLNFFAEIGMNEEEKGIAMIELMVKTEKLDKSLWENHKVIVCGAFLESLEDAYKNRKNKIITLDEIRAKFEDGVSYHNNPQGDVVSYPENPASCELTGKNKGNNPQTKLKETKVNKTKGDICDSGESPKCIALLDREPKNDLERVNKKWLLNYIALYKNQPINPRWDLSSPLVSKAIKQAGIEKVINALDTAMQDEFCLKAGYILKIIMSGNVISRLINKPPSSGPPSKLADKKSLSGLKSIFPNGG